VEKVFPSDKKVRDGGSFRVVTAGSDAKAYADRMNAPAMGLVAVLVGLLFCFAGSVALRFTLALWGALVGFSLGAGLVEHFWSSGLLSSALSWVVGAVFALVFSAFAYLYYWVAVMLAAVSAGLTLGAGLMSALGIEWNWLIALSALAVGVVVGFIAIAFDLPHFFLIALSALAGSATAVAGIMLMVGALEISDFDNTLVTATRFEWFWYAGYLVLAFIGMGAQSRRAERWAKEAWEQPAA
jgi:hypothetical protein